MKRKLLIVALLSAAALAGCSSQEGCGDRKWEKSTGSVAPLKVPEGLDNPSRAPAVPLPDHAKPEGAEVCHERPPQIIPEMVSSEADDSD
ncbi:MAG: hypothetical protein V3U59_00090 [Gammaproteobacteria bacterium]